MALPNIEEQRRCAGLFASLADAAALTARIEALTGAWRDDAWSATVGSDSAE